MIDDEEMPANLIILPPREERIHGRSSDGRTRPRAKVEAVEALCREAVA